MKTRNEISPNYPVKEVARGLVSDGMDVEKKISNVIYERSAYDIKEEDKVTVKSLDMGSIPLILCSL